VWRVVGDNLKAILYTFRWGPDSLLATHYIAHAACRALLRKEEFARIRPDCATCGLTPLFIDKDRVALVINKSSNSPAPGGYRYITCTVCTYTKLDDDIKHDEHDEHKVHGRSEYRK
jgi:hypothetical protein